MPFPCLCWLIEILAAVAPKAKMVTSSSCDVNTDWVDSSTVVVPRSSPADGISIKTQIERKEEKLKAIDALTIISDVVIKVNAIHLLFQIRMNRNRWQMCQSGIISSLASLQAFASKSYLRLFLKKHFRWSRNILSLPYCLSVLPSSKLCPFENL